MEARMQENKFNSYDSAKLHKLTLEIEDLKRKAGWGHRIGQCTPIVTALIAIAALWVGMTQFNTQQSLNSEINRQTGEREFKKPVWDRQLGIYFELSNAASKIASLPPEYEERKKAEARFWELYWGPVVFVEDQELKEAMVEFGNCLDGASEDCGSAEQKTKQLKTLSLKLAEKCRKALGFTWEIPSPELYRDLNRKRDLP